MSVAVSALPYALDRVLAKAGTTGRVAAQTMGMTEQTMSAWRSGRKAMNPQMLHELARRTPGAAPEELEAAHVCSAGVVARYDCGDLQDHPLAHLARASKEDADEDHHRQGIDLLLSLRREVAAEGQVAQVRAYNRELAQEIDAKMQLLAASCGWLGDSLTDTMRKARG